MKLSQHTKSYLFCKLFSGVPADKVGLEAGEMLLNQLFHGGCVDDFLQDQVHYMTPYGPRYKKTCLRGSANNTGADQPVHPSSLISALIIRFLESNICKLATSEISIF